jgi:cell division protein FtsB
MRTLILVLFAMLLWLQYRMWIGPGSFAEVQSLAQKVALQEQDVKRLVERNTVLEAEVIDLKKNGEALEERARLDLGMIRQGEIFYQAIEPTPADTKPADPPPLAVEPPVQRGRKR